MEIIVDDAAAQVAAERVESRVRERPNLVLGLATGRTMRPLYAALVEMHRAHGLRFAGVRTVNLDEYVGIGPDAPGAFARDMHAQFFRHIDIDAANTHLPNGRAADLDAEAERYERLIADLGGIDLQLAGIGGTGHIGFNEPPSSFDSRTRVVRLHPATRKQNAPQFGGCPNAVPERAITMGVGTIMDARELVVLVTGAAKAPIAAAALRGPITEDISASAIQWHPRATVILDSAAGSDLAVR